MAVDTGLTNTMNNSTDSINQQEHMSMYTTLQDNNTKAAGPHQLTSSQVPIRGRIWFRVIS